MISSPGVTCSSTREGTALQLDVEIAVSGCGSMRHLGWVAVVIVLRIAEVPCLCGSCGRESCAIASGCRGSRRHFHVAANDITYDDVLPYVLPYVLL